MTAPLFATREALAAAECSCGHPVGEGWHTSSRGCVYLGVGRSACPCERDWADALLASGVVRDPATLADAWEQGAKAGHHSPLTWFALRQVNPYRAAALAEDPS